jgi:hypothetical protein
VRRAAAAHAHEEVLTDVALEHLDGVAAPQGDESISGARPCAKNASVLDTRSSVG